MKIVVFAGNGGSAGLRGGIHGFLHACGVEPDVLLTVICTPECAFNIGRELPSNVSIVETPDANIRLTHYLKGCRLPNSVVEMIRQIDPDIVYFINGVVLDGAQRYHTVVGMHNQLFARTDLLLRQRPWKTLLSLLIQRHFTLRGMKKADLTVFESQNSMDQCRKRGILFRRGVVAHFGVPESERREGPAQKELHEPPELLYVSAIFPYKNQIPLLYGVRLLADRGERVLLHLVGSGPERYVARLNEKIQQLELQDQVIMHAWVEHSTIKDMIDQCDLFVYASSIETSGLGLMEGMARGAVIACNDESCMGEILGSGGVLFNVHDPESIASAISRLLQDQAMRRELAERALEQSRKYTWENHAKKVFSAFREFDH